MGSSADYAWVYQSLGALVGAVGALFFFRSLFHDRSRGHRRCPRCWYGMDGVPGLRCPECGLGARCEGRLWRTHRYWTLAILGAIASTGGWLIARSPDIHRRGWIALTPTTALIWWTLRHQPGWPPSGASPTATAPSTELAHRMTEGALTGWQWRWVLHEVPLIRAHARWDTQTPMPVEINAPAWLPIDRVHIVPKLRHGNELYFLGPAPQDAGFLEPGQQHARFEVSVKIGSFGRSKWRWTGELRLPVTTTESRDQAFAPLQSPDLDAAVAGAMRLRVLPRRNSRGTSDGYVSIAIGRGRDPCLPDLAFGLVVEMVRDDQVVRSLRMPGASFRDRDSFPLANASFSWPYPRDWMEPDDTELARWSLRIRGDRAMALASWSHDAYWAGELRVPLAPYYVKP